MNTCYIALFLLCCTADCIAKCAFETYTLEGVIANASGAPQIKTKVGIEWRDYTQTHKKSAVTDSAGHYQLTIPFNTYSGHGAKLDSEDVCKLKLEQISLRINDNIFNQKIEPTSTNKITIDLTQ
jgi:hypothetical protein